MNLWPVEHFVLGFFQISTYMGKKTEDISVQLVRGSFLSKYFLQNPYFIDYGSFTQTQWLALKFKICYATQLFVSTIYSDFFTDETIFCSCTLLAWIVQYTNLAQ